MVIFTFCTGDPRRIETSPVSPGFISRFRHNSFSSSLVSFLASRAKPHFVPTQSRRNFDLLEQFYCPHALADDS